MDYLCKFRELQHPWRLRGVSRPVQGWLALLPAILYATKDWRCHLRHELRHNSKRINSHMSVQRRPHNLQQKTEILRKCAAVYDEPTNQPTQCLRITLSASTERANTTCRCGQTTTCCLRRRTICHWWPAMTMDSRSTPNARVQNMVVTLTTGCFMIKLGGVDKEHADPAPRRHPVGQGSPKSVQTAKISCRFFRTWLVVISDRRQYPGAVVKSEGNYARNY